jgi:hypothetical protein
MRKKNSLYSFELKKKGFGHNAGTKYQTSYGIYEKLKKSKLVLKISGACGSVVD